LAQTKVVIVYSPDQCRRRVAYVPDDDAEVPGLLAHVANFDSRLGLMVGDRGDYHRLGLDEMLKRFTGRPPSSDRCIVKGADGTVAAVIHGDPTLDTHPLGQILHDITGNARVGQMVVAGIAS